MPDEPTKLQALVEAIRLNVTIENEKRDAMNRANRYMNTLKKMFRDWIVSERKSPEVCLVVDGIEYRYCGAEREIIDPAKWLQLLVEGTLTKEQFLEAITVGKAEAKKLIGEDQMLLMTEKIVGDTASVRSDDENVAKYPTSGVQIIEPPAKISTTNDRKLTKAIKPLARAFGNSSAAHPFTIKPRPTK